MISPPVVGMASIFQDVVLILVTISARRELEHAARLPSYPALRREGEAALDVLVDVSVGSMPPDQGYVKEHLGHRIQYTRLGFGG